MKKLRQAAPTPLEIEYENKMALIQKHLVSEVKRGFFTNLRSLKVKRLNSLDQSYWRDIKDIINRIKMSHKKFLTQLDLRQMLMNLANKTLNFNGRQLNRILEKKGEKTPRTNPNFQDTIDTFVESNISVIKSIETRYLDEVEQIVLQGVNNAQRIEDIASQIAQRGLVSVSRAKFIARDQVAKVNAQIAEARQRNLGIKRYVWRTSRDERVRDSHRDREGKVFSWNKPPEGGHPGIDYGCRCTSEPIIE